MTSRAESDRGAILIHVAFAILALIAFTTFVVDMGVLWLARGQAQNSADAGALAGAIALSYDDPTDLSDTGPGKLNARLATQNNLVYGQPPDVNISTDVTIPAAPYAACPNGVPCVRVDVYRNQARGNPLPIMFGTLVGLVDQGIRATATAEIRAGNASNCLKPWAVPDKWFENEDPPWLPTSTYDRYDKDGNVLPGPPTPDLYVPPGPTTTGSGFTISADYGAELVLKPGNPNDALSPGLFYPIVLDPTCIGGNCYRDSIGACSGVTNVIGDPLTVEPGNMIGPTQQGVTALIAQDQTSSWNPTTQMVDGGCMAAGTCTLSPRIVALPVFNLDIFEQGRRQSGRLDLIIVNILGFYISHMSGNDVVGYLMTHPALFDAGGGTVTTDSSFIKTIVLVR